MGDEPKTKQEVIKRDIYNGYLYEVMRRLKLRGIDLPKLPDFNWIVYGDHYDNLGDYILKGLDDFTPPKEVQGDE